MEIFSLALTAILTNKLRSSLTILGIVIGVTSVIILVAMVSGLKSFITEQISSLGPNVIFVIPGKITGGRGPGGVQVNRLTVKDALNLKNKLRNDADVSAGIQTVTKIKYLNKLNKNATVVGVWPNYASIIKSIKVTDGRMFNQSEENSGKKVAVIGPTVKKNLFGSGDPLGKQIEIGSNRYQVIGVMSERGSNFGIDLDNFAVIPLSTAQKQIGENNIHNILIAAKSADTVKEVQQKATNVLLQRLSDDDFTIQTQEQTLSTVSQITGILTIALGGIAAISLVVGGIGIMNIMLVSVTERTREIGLRKALGARPTQIRNQFIIESLTLSGLGGIIGIILGISLALLINNFLKTTVPLWSIALSFGFSMLVGVVFGVIPAVRAAKLDPIQALRYE